MSGNETTTHTEDAQNAGTAGGLLEDAQILTMTGYVAVQDLEAGARIVTRRGVRVLRDLHQREIMTRPIKISPNTLGFSRPATGMFVVPGQQVLVRDWRAQALFNQDTVVLPIERLVDDVLIYFAEEDAMHRVFTLEFDNAEVFYADGVEVVSDERASQKPAKPMVLVA